MRLNTTYLNERIELFDGQFNQDAHRALNAVARLYNRHIGPVTTLSLERPGLLDPSMYCASCNHSPMGAVIPDLTVRPSAADQMSIPGGGKGPRLQQPLMGALGELAERLLAVLHFQAVVDDLEYATWEQLVRRGLSALGPEELPLFAPQQYTHPGFAFRPFRPDTPLRWIEGTDLLSGEPIFVPAQLVMLYYKRARGEEMIGYPTSGGLAFHSDRRHAILHALYEYIERDAVNVRWYCRLAPPRVELDLAGFLASQWHLRHTRISTPAIENIRIYLSTLDVPIPIFTVVALDTSRRERMFLGAGGAWSNRERALAQALFELGQTRAVLNSYKPGRKEIHKGSDAKEMTDFLDGAVYFGYEENLPRLDWYTSTPATVQWSDVPTLSFAGEADEYDAVLGWLRETNLKPVVVDMSGACWPGVHVTRVIIPQLTAACVGAHPYLGHPRYARLPFEQLNTDPIPFP